MFAPISIMFDNPKDNFAAIRDVQNRVELKPELAEYWSFIETRISPLAYDDITNSLGQQLDRLPDDNVAPFCISGITISGFHFGKNDKSHTDVYAIGDTGYLEVFYLADGASVYTAVIFLRTDDKFVPLQSTSDLARRQDWDKAKYELATQWLDRHLPKLTDLGVVKISSEAPSRIALGNGKTCLVTSQLLSASEMSNGTFRVVLALDTTNAIERDQPQIFTRSANGNDWLRDVLPSTVEHDQSAVLAAISRPGPSISFKMAGNFYRLTPKLEKP